MDTIWKPKPIVTTTVTNPNAKNHKITPKQGNVLIKTEPGNDITMAMSRRKETKANVEIRNECNEWVVFRLKTTNPDLFLLKPCTHGVIGPNDLQPLQLVLLRGHFYPAQYLLLMEMALVPKIASRKKMSASIVWKFVENANITQRLVKLRIVDPGYVDPAEKFHIYLDIPNDILQANSMERAKSVLRRFRREDLMAPSLILLSVYVIFAFLFGYLTRSFHYPCAKYKNMTLYQHR